MTADGRRQLAATSRALVWTLALAVLTSSCASGPGDSRARQGASTGAAIGIGLGLLAGILSGDPDKAARAVVVGAASGAVSGGYEGWRQDQEDERARQITQAIRESSVQASGLDAEARQREELTRFLGTWEVQGWVDDAGTRRTVNATAYGDVQMMQFVELAWIDLAIEGVNGQVWGTTMLGYSSSNGYSLSTRLNIVPDSFGAQGGTFEAAQRAFTFSDPQGVTTIRFENPDRFTLVTVAGGKTLETYTFTRTG